MGVYLDDFPGALQPRRTPFEDEGAPRAPCVFIYMTNRQNDRWSYLMPPGFEREHDPSNHISVGYTQLWIMEKLHCVAPRTGSRSKRDAEPPPFETGVMRDDFPVLFHVLREPRSTSREYHDHIGGRRDFDSALAFAQAYSDRHRCRVLVAKLVHDWQWH